MRIRPATADDIQAATDCMVAAFSGDPHLDAFFHDSPLGRDLAAARFFALLLEARLSLGMPALVASPDGILAGVAMGYDTEPPTWPADLQQRWQQMEASHSALAARFETSDRIMAAAQLDMPHYYLGVLAVHPEFQGRGIGKALIRAFLDLSDSDSRSQGTSLETAKLSNLGLYESLGFQTCSSGLLEQAMLWCMFRPKPASFPA